MSKERLDPEEYAAALPKAVVSASVFFTDEHDQPMQLHSVYSPEHPWQWPGGTTEAGERPWETAVREAAEETGLVVSRSPRLLAAVFGLPGPAFQSAAVTFVFDGGQLTDEQLASIVLAPEEHDEVRAMPLEQWRTLMPVKDFDRLTAVMEAHRNGVAAYVGAWD
ncbi:NUDIX domain-containing protein [Streptomyces sp. SID685]|uniref:NUDIX domain-containing protein n=1 Tax=Streptomyces TaxID=1883 RepID=UPI001370D00F|nr:NUDIX hydrolase [Streptomyces sp. SID685]MYR89911.1 NUDIX domain-containing protein [Streptomyces sp. SID685]